METALIEALKPYGPLAMIGGLIAVLLRKEIGRALFSARDETAVEKLLVDMAGTFKTHMDLLRDSNDTMAGIAKDIDKIETHSSEHLSVSRALLQETIRNNRN